MSSLWKVADGWREEEKSPEHASFGCLAAFLTPLLSVLVPVTGQGESVSWEMPVLSEQMSAAAAVGYLTGLTSFPWLCWQPGKLHSLPLFVAPAFLVV